MSDAEPTSSAFVGRRIVALLIDWVIALLISSAFFIDGEVAPVDETAIERVLLAGHPLATLAIFAVHHWLLVATLGSTIGHRLVGLRLIRVDGAPVVGFIRALFRTGLLLVVIPAVVYDAAGRGLHDLAAGTRFQVIGAEREAGR